MKTAGNGFKYWLDDTEIKDFEAFEKTIKNKEVIIIVDKLNVRATTKQ